LFLAEKYLDEATFRRWCSNKKEAELKVINREEEVAAVDGQIEVELELIGSTAIEDRL